jgi:hypothetical protein
VTNVLGLFQRWRRSNRWLEAERQLLDAAGRDPRLEAIAASLRSQIDGVREIVRVERPKGFDAYPNYQPNILWIPDRSVGRLAALDGTAEKASAGTVRAEIHQDGGLIARLVVEGDAAIDPTQLRLTGVRVLEVRSPSIDRPIQLKGWVKEMHAAGQLGRLSPPLPQKKHEELRSRHAFLPPDYFELVDQTNGASVGDYALFGLDEVYRLKTPKQREYAVIADLQDEGCLGVWVDSGNAEPEILVFDEASPEGLAFAETVREAIHRLAEGL